MAESLYPSIGYERIEADHDICSECPFHDYTPDILYKNGKVFKVVEKCYNVDMCKWVMYEMLEKGKVKS